MNLLGKVKKKITQIKNEWVTPEEQPSIGGLTLRTPDGKTTITISLTDSKDAYKAKQLVNLALQDTESYDDDFYHLGTVDMEE